MTPNLQHVVFFTPGFPADENDWNCIPILQNYVFYFSKLNPETLVSVISFQYPFETKVYEWNGIKVYAAGGKNKKYLSRVVAWFRVLMFFKKINRIKKVDVIHSFWLTECTLIAQWIKKFYNIRIVATILGQDCLPQNKYLKLIDFSKTKIVASSTFADKIYNKSTGNNADEIISIGLDKERFTVPVSDFPDIDILGVGNLYPLKNYSLFIDIIHELVRDFPNLKVLIAGEGVEFEMLNKKIHNLNLTGNISMLGKVDRQNIITLMARSKILLHTSKHEGQGYVFEEALYSGMSIVAFQVGNLFQDERIRIGNSKTELHQHMKTLLNKLPSRERVLMHDLNKTVDRYKSVYSK